MTEIHLPYNWRPRPYQVPLWRYLQKGGKRAVAVWHRRAGKDDVALHWAAWAAHDRVATYWHMLPQANQARKAIWEAINPHTGKRRIDEAFPLEIRETTKEQDMMIRFKCGSTWQVVGSDNYDSLVGSPPAGVVFSEWAIANPRAWAYLSPILIENGGWAMFIYTPRGLGHGKDTYDEACEDSRKDEFGVTDPRGWFAERLSVDDTKVLSPDQIRGAKKELYKLFPGQPEAAEAYFRQEYHCSFTSAVLGSYYGSQMEEAEKERRICHVPYDKGLLVNTAWDLGAASGHTVIWFYQQSGREIHVIDFHVSSDGSLEGCVEVLRERGYRYGTHFWPHDGDARELGTGKTRVETIRSFGVGNVRVLPRGKVEDGINAVRRILPRCFFDKDKTAEGLEALRSYHREWDDERRVFNERPYHDWSSHPADAFRYLAMGLQEPSTPVKKASVEANRKWIV